MFFEREYAAAEQLILKPVREKATVSDRYKKFNSIVAMPQYIQKIIYCWRKETYIIYGMNKTNRQEINGGESSNETVSKLNN